MNYPLNFIRRTEEFSTYEKHIPAPLFRKSVYLKARPLSAELLICGLGFYELHLNGEDITKGYLAPYRSNVNDIIYYDRYGLEDKLSAGENVIGVILGSGMMNPVTTVWDFDKLPWRGAPLLSFSLSVEYEDGEKEVFISDESVKTADSPILFEAMHFGEYYDARLEKEGWDCPGYDDSGWDCAIPAKAPLGEPMLCTADPVLTREELRPVSIRPFEGGYIYDFGYNGAGLCRLKIKGEAGQKIITKHFELADGNGVPCYTKCKQTDRVGEDEYTCKGEGTEVHFPRFTYHGFRYVHVLGITEEQATEDLLTYVVFCSDIESIGSFECDNSVVNALQAMTRRADLTNFHHFPTDCPQREKNGWTADAALSAEQTLLNFAPDKSYAEWMLGIYKAVNEKGQLPGIIPTGGWGYAWGNGPAWDKVLVEIPYYTYKYRGDKSIFKRIEQPLMRYITYLYQSLDKDGLIEMGLGDWCPVGHFNDDGIKMPLKVSTSVISCDIARKAAFIFRELGMKEQADYCEALAVKIRAAVREHLIDEDLVVSGSCQSSQSLGLYYGMFEETEKEKAFSHLVRFVEEADVHLDTGVLGARAVFDVLSDNGRADLAFKMIARTDYPSYGHLVELGETTLTECFVENNDPYMSHNHHFWGHISAWFYTALGGLKINPEGKGIQYVSIAPCFIEELGHVKCSHKHPYGEISIEWTREGGGIELLLHVPDGIELSLSLPEEIKVHTRFI